MQQLTIVMPKMGESVAEAIVIKWLKKEEEEILEGDPLLEVATDKVDSEIPASYSGRLIKILVQQGQVIPVGSPIAIIETEQQTTSPAPLPTSKPLESPSYLPTLPSSKPMGDSENGSLPLYDKKGRFYSPLVRHIAQSAALTPEEIASIPGTGQNYRLTKQDLLNYIGYKTQGTLFSTPTPPTTLSPYDYAQPGDEIVAMNRVRRIIAARMVESLKTIPHVTSFVEADVTNLVVWRANHKGPFKHQTGIELTYTPLFIQAIAQAIVQFPLINVSVVDNYIIRRKAINIGIAVALPNGNLIVPVIKGANTLSLLDLTKQIHNLVQKARTDQLAPDDIADGTYTVSNIGSFQNLMGTPIIVQPQVAILALGAIEKRAAVMESPTGEQIVIRHKMYLSHTYDHRVVDGALGGQFVKNVAERLEKFDPTTSVINYEACP